MKKLTRRLGERIPKIKKLLQINAALETDVSNLHRLVADMDQTIKQRDSRNQEWAREVRVLRKELEEARNWIYVPHGHFYSPIPNLAQIKKRAGKIWKSKPSKITDVELNEGQQIKLASEFKKYYGQQPFGDKKQKGLRFYFLNGSYSYSDGLGLYSMIRHFKPKRIIEIGSGFSSAVTLDTNELFFDGKIKCTFIDPYPGLVNSLLKKDDRKNNTFIKSDLQNLDPKIFSQLESGDILFVDSTHVSKVDSDVNYIFFEILPRLKAGVLIHFHDIFYPFEYPKDWVLEGRGWTEAYMLRAFLQNNKDYEIIFYTNFMRTFNKSFLLKNMSLFVRDRGGSIWLRKKGSPTITAK